LLGIERDTFLLLLGHMGLENTDKKTRNVWNIFLIFLRFFVLHWYIDVIWCGIFRW
jgi:hypothetical protein